MIASNINFMNALAIWNGGSIEEIDRIIEDDELHLIIETEEKLNDFISARGKPCILSDNTDFGYVAMWENVQKARGLRRGNLYVVEYEDKTLTYFDGEA